MTPRWRFLHTGYADGPYNMALDEALLGTIQSQGGPITVRAYGWQPAVISVGYGQNVLRDIDIDTCHKGGMDIVRRLTGGRAVLHDEEVTYSIVAPEGNPMIGGRIHETYNRIGRALVCGLRHLGIRAELHRVSSASGRNPSCFSSTGRYEVVVGGMKLIGSAQRRIGGAILQHGSLLTGPGYKGLTKFLRRDVSPAPAESSTNHVTTLSEILGYTPSFDRIADSLRLGFEEVFDCQLIEGTLTEEEQTVTQKLIEERYERDEWNQRLSVSQSKKGTIKSH